MRQLKALFAFAIFTLIFVCFFSIGVLAADTPVDPASFLGQVLDFIKGFGGLSWFGKLSGILLIVVASMKVSFLNDLIWSKLGALQAWLAPLLGLLTGIVSLLAGGQPITLAALTAYLAAGAGAVALHQLLDTLKVVPGLGSVWVSIINVIESALGGPASKKTLPTR